MQNISFQGRTNLIVATKTFDTISEICNQRCKNMYADTSEFINGAPIAVGLDNQALAVVVKGEKRGFINRFSSKSNLDDFLLNLQEKVEILKRTSKEKLTAWIIGGKTNDTKTINTVNDIADIICDRPDIDASILVGQGDGKMSKFIVHGRTQVTDIILPDISHVKSADEIEDAFDIVEFNDVTTSFDKPIQKVINRYV